MVLDFFRNSHYDNARGCYIVYERETDSHNEFEILAELEHQMHPNTPVVIHRLDGSEKIITPNNGATNGMRQPLIKNGKLVK